MSITRSLGVSYYLRDAPRSSLASDFFVLSYFSTWGLSWLWIRSLSHIPIGKAKRRSVPAIPTQHIKWKAATLSSGAGRKLVVSLKPTPISPGARALYHEREGGCSCNCARDMYSGQQKTTHTMPGRPIAAHRVKYLIHFTCDVWKFLWLPPPEARDLMPISHTPLETFANSVAFTVVDSKFCGKKSVPIYGPSPAWPLIHGFLTPPLLTPLSTPRRPCNPKNKIKPQPSSP